MRKNPLQRVTGMLLIAAMVFNGLQVTAIAEGTHSGTTMNYSVTGFTELAEDIAVQSVPLGTSMRALVLPGTLTATGSAPTVATPSEGMQEENDITISGVKWQSAPEYDPDTPDTYTFTAVLPQGYILADSVGLPVIAVELSGSLSMEGQIFGTDGSPKPAIYDQQPTTKSEVREAIDKAEAAYTKALQASGFEAALEAMTAAKPHWEFAVDTALIPEGYHCELVMDDAEFGVHYYTFFVDAAPLYNIVTNQTEFKNAISNMEPEIIIANDISLTRPTRIEYPVKIIGEPGVSLYWANPTAPNPDMLIVTSAGNLTIESLILDAQGRDGTLVYVNDGIFTMNDGTILKRINSQSANNAVRLDGGSFIMNSGLITEITSDYAVHCKKGDVIMENDAAIIDNNSAAIYITESNGIRASLSMGGHSNISNNCSMQGASAGTIDGTDIIMGIKEGDAPSVMYNLSQDYSAGGWYLKNGSTLSMSYGAKINSNVSSQDGGGLLLEGNSSITMKDQAEISGNYCTGEGGGLNLKDKSLLEMSGNASIHHNIAENGAGVYSNGTIKLSQSPQILDGLYFNNKSNAPVITDALTSNAKVQLEASDYVSSAKAPFVIAEKPQGQLTETDRTAWLLPKEFNGYGAVLNATKDQVLIDLETYSITYIDLFGADNPNPASYTVSELPIYLSAPEARAGYTFSGWYDAQNGDNKVIQITADDMGDKVFFARWVPDITFTVQNSVNLNRPTDLLFQVDNATPLTGFTFDGVRFTRNLNNPPTGFGQKLTASDGVTYINGALTIPAVAFGQHNQKPENNPLTSGSYRAEIIFTDGDSSYFEYYADFILTSDSLTPVAPAITTVTLPGGTVGVAYSATLAATGDAPITWKLDRGSLPGGLTLSAGGVISGTPTAAGTYDFTVKASNGTAPDAIKAFNISVSPSGDGGSSFSDSGSGSTTTTVSGSTTVNQIKVPYISSGGVLTSNITASNLRSIVDKAYKNEYGGRIVKTSYNGISGSDGLTSLTLTLDASKLKADEDVTFIIETPFGVFTYTTAQILEWFGGNTFGIYSVTLEKSSLKSSLKVDVKKDGKSAAWNKLTPMARIGVAYTPKTGESTASLVVTDKNGRILPTSVYENGMVYADIFTLGTYKAMAAASTAFTDTAGHPAKANIDYVTMRGLISGTSSTAYSPDAAITRVEYIMALGKLEDANISDYEISSFTDVSNSSAYMPYIEWAVAKKIVAGYNGNFSPDDYISRQDLAAILWRYAQHAGIDVSVGENTNILSYNDAFDVTEYAIAAMQWACGSGIIGSKPGNLIDPQGRVTRAEAATTLHQFVEFSSRNTNGWSNVNTDLNKFVYYTQNGVVLTGWQTIGGKWYYFGSDGVMRTGWAVIDDNGKAVTGWPTTTTDNWYWFDDNGIMGFGKWIQIGGKWYYFYSDGKLALNTTIDGHEVGADGARKE